MSEATGFYDTSGIPIHVGDLIRVKHFKHYRGKRQMWLYFRVATIESRYVVQNWSDLDAAQWQCQLSDCGIESAEVLAEHGLQRNDCGEIITFNERNRLPHVERVVHVTAHFNEEAYLENHENG